MELPPTHTVTLKSKRKNFLWHTNPEWISGLLQIMCEYVDANMRSAQDFKDSVYKGASQKLKEKFGIEVTSEQCKNQIRHQRTIWSRIQELKRKSGVSWDESKKMILMGQEEYTSHIQAFPKDVPFLNMSIANYTELEKVCGEGHATGEWAKFGNSQTPFGSQEISLDDDEPVNFIGFGADASQPIDSAEIDIEEDSMGPINQSNLSSSKRCIKRKRNKNESVNQSIRDCIILMADSVAKVAEAMHNTTRVSEETKLCTRLMTELSSVPGFSDEEVDIIYDKLSKNPALIISFLAKPVESKGRWMRMELDK